ncbi:MAG: hypothetical protein A2W91_09915 [Bacteroidetes bacterium GWF2_38_335]|nr:MAG: hypothetical protein A2W91_09915 [Bacteroidetes bacterium GWF2_38_335]HBS88057.1 hypothetical protein [Bacteroidales bacterium]
MNTVIDCIIPYNNTTSSKIIQANSNNFNYSPPNLPPIIINQVNLNILSIQAMHQIAATGIIGAVMQHEGADSQNGLL